MLVLNFMEEKLSPLTISELLVLCVLLNMLNILLTKYWKNIRTNIFLMILVGLYYCMVISLTIYVVHLGLTFAKIN
jgi:hypothetical protein